MPKRKKKFPCGHVGHGRFCHRCAEKEAQRQQSAQRRQAWQAELAAAPIPLEHLPREVAQRVLEVLADLDAGASYVSLQGKRLHKMGQRSVISIPIGLRFRLICREIEETGKLVPLEALSHEAYNTRLATGGWPD
jgi:hypothetical protein